MINKEVDYRRQRYLKTLVSLNNANETIELYESTPATGWRFLFKKAMLGVLYWMREGSKNSVERERVLFESACSRTMNID